MKKGTSGEIPVTVSVGVAHGLLGEDVDKDIEALVREADGRLLRAKSGGKDRVVAG